MRLRKRDLMTQFGGELRPTDLDALFLGSRHASSSPFADLLRLDLGQEREKDVANQLVVSCEMWLGITLNLTRTAARTIRESMVASRLNMKAGAEDHEWPA
jgi:hypothetical protein